MKVFVDARLANHITPNSSKMLQLLSPRSKLVEPERAQTNVAKALKAIDHECSLAVASVLTWVQPISLSIAEFRALMTA